jgi:hypothetical protein
MKNLLILYILLTVPFEGHAELPQGIPYQAIARNSSGNILVNQNIRVRFTVRDSVATGTIKYQETFNPTTNTLGLFNVNVGMGTVVSGTFTGINWGINAKYMQVEMDPAGGTAYVDMGTTQMMSVPYALHAGSTAGGTLPTAASAGDILYYNGESWQKLQAGSDGEILTIQNGIPKWLNNAAFLTVGVNYQGGKVAYLLQPTDTGYDPLVPHGLIAATSDMVGNYQWGCGGILGTTSPDLGEGLNNSIEIAAGTCGVLSGAKVCLDAVIGGYSDWFLPSTVEINKLYSNRNAIGGFENEWYWTSTEYLLTPSQSYSQHFGPLGTLTVAPRTFTYKVRPIRKF